MALVFISHASADNETTQEIFEALKKAGFEYVFLDYDDEKGIQTGEDWEKRLYDELKRSYALVVLISPAWIESKWCFAEYTQAKALGKEIIPIIIDHGAENEVDKWIDNHIQKSDFTQDKKALNRAINRLKEIALDTQKGFEWDKNRPVYPGLISFEERDAAIFYGRESETREVIEALNKMHYKGAPKLLNIVAASGMGKSSLLKAGVLPHLKKSYQERWIVLDTLKPTQRPLYEFAKLIARFLQKPDSYKPLFNNLTSNDYKLQLDDIVSDIENTRNQRASILLPIDQAEEFYSVADKEEKKRFFEVLEYLLQKEHFFTIWTLRSDFLKEFQKDKSAFKLHKSETLYSLSPVAKESIASIIKEPAKIGAIEVENRLVERLKEDMKESEALPLLAMMLHKLYVTFGEKEHKLTLKDYESFAKESTETNKRVSPLESIIQTIADEAIEEFKEDQSIMEALKKSFIPHLVRVNENQEYVKREALLEQIPKEATPAIEALVKARLLIKNEKEGKITLEISHEALIRKWNLLQEWLEGEKEFLIVKSKVETALREWETNNKKNNALLSGLNLENAIKYKEKLEKEEKEFVELSEEHDKKQKRRWKIFYATFFAVVLLFSIFSFVQWNKALANEKKALQSEQHAKEELVKARHNIGLAMVEKAKNLATNGLILEANLVSYKALTLLDKKIDRSDAVSEVKNIIYNNRPYFIHLQTLQIQIMQGDKDNVSSVSFSPDGSKIVSGSRDKSIKIWDNKSGTLLQTLKGHKDYIYSVSFSPDGYKIFSSSLDKNIRIWDSKSGTLLSNLEKDKYYITNECQKSVSNVSFSPDGSKMVVGSKDDTIKIWNSKSGTLLQILKGHKDSVYSVSFSPDGSKIVSGSDDKTIKIWDSKSGTLLQTLKGHKNYVLSVSFSPDGSKIVSGASDKTIKIWDSKSGALLQTLQGYNDIISSVSFSPDGSKIVSGSNDKTIKIWDSKSGALLQILKGHKDSVYSVSFSPDGSKIVSGSDDKTIKIWDSKSGTLLQTLKGHKNYVLSVSFSPDGSKIVSGSGDKTIKIWDSKSGTLLLSLQEYNDIACSVSFSPDGSKIVSGLDDKTIKIWDSKSGTLLQTLQGHKNYVYSVSFSPDGSKIVSGSWDKTIRIWDIAKLNDKAFINKKIKELQNSLGMKLEGVRFVPLDEEEK